MSKYILIGFFLIDIILLKNHVYAKEDNFEIFSKCNDEYESSCNIIRKVNGVNDLLLEDVKSPIITKINRDIFMVRVSCGSPCQINFFYGKNEKDSTSEFIKINERNNCLVESDSDGKKIYARTLFTSRKKMIADLNKKEYLKLSQRFDYYSYFKNKSKFLENGNFILVANDYSSSLIKKTIINPCGGDNELFR